MERFDLKDAKRKFLSIYNEKSSNETALTMAIKSALGRNQTYSKKRKVTESERTEFRKEWKRLLEELAKKYQKSCSEEVFMKDVVELKETINNKFGDFFENKFRISHAQKSIAVYLKHLWCLNEISEPPICPVDRTILEKVNAPEKLKAWTKVDDIKTYNDQLKVLKDKAGKESLASWEIKTFQNK